jgi:tetratricopeptide (TPR) repeat protein
VRHLGCLAQALKSRGRSKEAAPILEEVVAAQRTAIATRPDDAEAHFTLGFVLAEQGKLDEAIAAYGATLRISPDNAIAHDNLGWILRKQGKLEEAEAEHLAALRIQPDFADAHYNLGVIFCDHKRDFTRAEAEFRTVIRLQPDNADAHISLGIALEGQGRFEEAIAELRAALRIRPDAARTHDLLAWALARQADPGMAAEALEHARRAVASDPSNGYWQNTLALAEYRAGHFDESIAAAERSIRLEKDVDASNWFFLAMAHARRGEADRARGFFDRAVAWTREHAPKDPQLLQFWGEAAALLGRPGPDAANPARLPELPADVFAS